MTQRYLNVPISRQARLRIFTISENGLAKRVVPLQLADDRVDYWIYLDIDQFKGKTVTVTGPATPRASARIYQDHTIRGAATMYKEVNRPQFHFTVKRGWNNDVNGPIFLQRPVPPVLAGLPLRRAMGHRFHVLGPCNQ